MASIIDNLELDQREALQSSASRLLGALVQANQYVGEVYSIGYSSALVQIHDNHRMKVGGIPGLCFLAATRISPGQVIDYQEEDSSVILLRVLDAAPMPNSAEADRIRVEAAQRAAGAESHWDSHEYMDGFTANLLSFAGVRCRVIGTFYLASDKEASERNLRLRFGGDLSNYYPNRGLKVYKPNTAALRCIVNYRDPERAESVQSCLSLTAEQPTGESLSP